MWPEKVPLLSYEELGSTSTHARSLLESGRRPPFAVFAKRQTAGRGRRGKSFFSPAGGVYCTLALPDVPEPESSLVTLLAAVALRAAILSVCGKETGIKWVNDLYCGGKKVCGILSERLEGGILIGPPLETSRIPAKTFLRVRQKCFLPVFIFPRVPQKCKIGLCDSGGK